MGLIQLFIWTAIGMVFTNLKPAFGQLKWRDSIPPLTYDYVVRYDMVLDFNGLSTYTAYLYTDGMEARYTYQRQDRPTALSESKVESDGYKFQFHILDSNTYWVAANLMDSIIYSMEQIPGATELFLVKENMEPLPWVFTGNRKQIGQYDCEEAKLQWRGRDFTAWFAPEIPITCGPWKLHGLPGVLLEVSDALHQVRFVAREFRVQRGHLPELGLGSFNLISREEYNRQIETYIENLKKKLSTRFDRQYQVEVTTDGIQSIERYEP